METAIIYSKKIMKMAFVMGAITSVGLIAFRPFIGVFFKLEPSSIRAISNILIVKALYSPLITFNWTNVIGILRSGGDTLAGLLLDIVPLWCVAVPLSFIGAMYFGWPIYIVILVGSIEEVIKLIFGLIRTKQNKWVKNITV